MSKLKKAMLRAEESRSGERETAGPLPEVQLRETRREARDRRKEPSPAEEVNPRYGETRVESTSPGVLERHKILSFLHEEGMSDTVKILRTQILHKLAEIGGKSLLVTSARPREGKTFTATNLAVSVSHEVHRTTLLVDTDLRRPCAHEFFGLAPTVGLSDYLLGQAEIPSLLVNPGLPRLTLLPGGSPLPNSSELLGSPRMAALVEELKERYPDRFLVFDSASLLTRADAHLLSRFVDGVLLVVEAERTSFKDVRRALELLNGSHLVGIVYNKSKD